MLLVVKLVMTLVPVVTRFYLRSLVFGLLINFFRIVFLRERISLVTGVHWINDCKCDATDPHEWFHSCSRARFRKVFFVLAWLRPMCLLVPVPTPSRGCGFKLRCVPLFLGFPYTFTKKSMLATVEPKTGTENKHSCCRHLTFQ